MEVLAIEGAPEVEQLEQQIEEWKAAGPIQGVYWLPALDEEGDIGSLEPADWRQALHIRVKLLATTMRALADQVEEPGTFLVSATRLGGRHGYDRAGSTSVLGGAVSGFNKALAREREKVLVKVVDFAVSRKKAALADILVEETLRDPGAVEIGYADDLRWSVALVERDAEADPARKLSGDTVFVITGAAGSIVSAITADLAAASGGTFHLLDLVPEPDSGDPDLDRSVSDPDGLKRELAERIQQRGERPTPKLVERELARIERARAARDAMRGRSGGRRHGPLAPVRSHRPEGGRGGAGRRARRRSRGRADALRGPRGQPLPPGQAAARVRPGIRREGGRLAIPAASPARNGDRHGGRVQLHSRPLRERRTDRLLGRQRPALQEHFEPASLGGHARGRDRLDGLGRASAWRAAAPFPR